MNTSLAYEIKSQVHKHASFFFNEENSTDRPMNTYYFHAFPYNLYPSVCESNLGK